MNVNTTCESELDLSKLSAYSFSKEPAHIQYEKISEMKKAFRKRKNNMESFEIRMLRSIKKEIEDDPRHQLLPSPVIVINNIANEKTPKIDFFPLCRPNRNKIG